MIPRGKRFTSQLLRGFGRNRLFFRQNSNGVSFYELLELPANATIKDVKAQFKKLSKKYHPDLNSHLPPDDKEKNSSKFVLIVTAYDTLKDAKKRKQYDMTLKGQAGKHMQARRDDWNNQYYGEARYYSKSGKSFSASGLNSNRHRVHRHSNHENRSSFDGRHMNHENRSSFDGRHMNHGDRYDVPHFNYNEHLSRLLKFEQRLINKRLSDEDREKVLKQLSKDGDISKLSDELITKHLMRQVHHNYNNQYGSQTSRPMAANGYTPSTKHQYMYEGPHDRESGIFKTLMLLGGASGSLYFLYNAIF
ncbi:uncharacterized protein PRCAT00005761001 [Priceomyces carsonii]|uniref:uncharacterized protein n=1 Tax=Priceomyces carsonii TaxID=28549 RepID=UPI002ED9F9FF|nr:unnamed protein product [Priceomyces carsonii]